jgi:hypothetical protein
VFGVVRCGTLSLILWVILTAPAVAADLTFAQEASLPPEVHQLFSRNHLDRTCSYSSHINPFYIQGDFNGVGRLDTAVLVQSRSSNKIGIAVFHAGGKHVYILCAGNRILGAGENDTFDWMDAWYAYRKGKVGRGVDQKKPPALRGDALYVEKTESANAIIYWAGSTYRWYQQGD